MKTAVSIPDDLFEQAERLARTSRKSLSEIFSAALREYVARHTPDEVTDALNRVCETLGLNERERIVERAARRRMESVEW